MCGRKEKHNITDNVNEMYSVMSNRFLYCVLLIQSSCCYDDTCMAEHVTRNEAMTYETDFTYGPLNGKSVSYSYCH